MSTTPAGAPDVRHNHKAYRYEILVEDRVAGFAEYVDNGERRTFTYTEIEPDQRGRGLGRQLVEAALADTDALGLTAVPQCSFVGAVMASRRHASPSSQDRSEHGSA